VIEWFLGPKMERDLWNKWDPEPLRPRWFFGPIQRFFWKIGYKLDTLYYKRFPNHYGRHNPEGLCAHILREEIDKAIIAEISVELEKERKHDN